MSDDAPHYGAMDERRARELLSPVTQPDSFELGFKFEATDWATWVAGDERATLDGDFTADQLEAIAWWMRNKG